MKTTFETEMDKAYDILWNLHKSGDLTLREDEQLVEVLNKIDTIFGR